MAALVCQDAEGAAGGGGVHDFQADAAACQCEDQVAGGECVLCAGAQNDHFRGIFENR